MENASNNVGLDSIHLEDTVLLATNHAKLVLTIQLNVLLALTIISVQMVDVFQHVLQDNILMLFQSHADNALQLVLLAAHNNFVQLVQTIKLLQSVVNVYHAFIHVQLAHLIYQYVNHV